MIRQYIFEEEKKLERLFGGFLLKIRIEEEKKREKNEHKTSFRGFYNENNVSRLDLYTFDFGLNIKFSIIFFHF